MNSSILTKLPLLYRVKFKRAFTLAEVLITLAVIGVVSAISIPSIITKVDNMSYVTALKKSYAILSQTTQLIISENGDMSAAFNGATTVDAFADVFIQKLNILKDCRTASAKASGCFPNINYKCLNGTDINTLWGSNFSTTNQLSTITTSDGLSYAFYINSTNCTTDLSGGDINSPLYNTCGTIWVDVNGPNKPPAMYGRDVFIFYITKKGLYPRGAFPDVWSSNCSNNGNGCAGKVLKEGAINY